MTYLNNWHPHVTGFPQTPTTGLKEQFVDEPYQVVVNVSDDPMWENAEWYRENSIEYYWFPMGDCVPLGLHSIYGALMVLWNSEKRGKKLLLHCAAGINRSQTVLDCFYYLRFNTHRIWTWMDLVHVEVNFGGGPNFETKYTNMLEFNCKRVTSPLPHLSWIEFWLNNLREQLETDGIQAGTYDMAFLTANENSGKTNKS